MADHEIRISARIDTSQMQRLQLQIDKATDKVENLREKAREVGEQKIPSEEYQKLEAELKEAQDVLEKLVSEENNFVEAGLNMGAPWESLIQKEADAGLKIDELKEKMQKLVEEEKAFSSGMDTEQYQQLSQDLVYAERNLSALNTRQAELMQKQGYTAEGFEQAGKSAKKAFSIACSGAKKTNGLFGTLVRRLKGIALSLLIFNWITKGFNAMVSAMKEGFKNLAQYSKNYNAQMSALKSSCAELKNGLAAAFEPVANFILPYLVQVVNWLNKAAAAMSQFLAAMSGKSTYTRAKKQNIDYAKSLDTASKSAKKALAAFDELNVLNDQSSGSSGGELTGADAFETAQVGSQMQTLVDNIKSQLQEMKNLFVQGFNKGLGDANGRLKTIRKSLASIKKSMVSIFSDENVLEAMQGFKDSFITMLGTVVGSVASIGLTIAANLVGGIAKYLEQNTARIKDFLINMFSIGENLNEMIAGFSEAFAYIFEAFASEEGQQLTANLIGILTDAFMGAIEIAAQLGRDLFNIIIKPFVDNKEEFRQAVEGLLGVLSEIAGSIKEAIDKSFDHFMDVYDEKIKPFFDSVADGLSDLVKAFLDFWNNNVQPILEQLAAKFDDVMKSHLQPFFDKLGDFIGTVFDNLKALWEKMLKPVVRWIIDNVLPVLAPIFQGVANEFMDMVGLISDWAGSLLDILGGIIDFIVGTFTGDWERCWEGIKSIFKGIINALISAFETFINGAISMLNGLIGGANAIAGKVGISGLIPTMDTVSLPRLANGAVIQGGQPFLAWLGDQPKGQTNIEAPLDTLVEAFKQAQAENGGGTYTFVAKLNEREIFRETVRQDRMYKNTHGQSAFI